MTPGPIGHATGPWRLQDDGPSASPRFRIHADYGEGYSIASVHGYLGQRHNADIICAAPELFDALVAVCDAGWRDRNKFVIEGRSLIARVRGEK